jgi:hypothetical protein
MGVPGGVEADCLADSSVGTVTFARVAPGASEIELAIDGGSSWGSIASTHGCFGLWTQTQLEGASSSVA